MDHRESTSFENIRRTFFWCKCKFCLLEGGWNMYCYPKQQQTVSSLIFFHQTLRFHPNCNYIATGSCDKTVRLWDITSGQCVRVFTGHKVKFVQGFKFLSFKIPSAWKQSRRGNKCWVSNTWLKRLSKKYKYFLFLGRYSFARLHSWWSIFGFFR